MGQKNFGGGLSVAAIMTNQANQIKLGQVTILNQPHQNVGIFLNKLVAFRVRQNRDVAPGSQLIKKNRKAVRS